MPMTAAQLLAGANTQLASYAKNDPVDQFSTKRPLMKWLMDNAEQSIFGNGVYNEKVLIGDSSNYQNYTGDDIVTYNRKDNHRLAPFQDYEAHDGFALNETELAHNGVNITEDSSEAVMSGAEKIQIVNIIRSNRATLKTGFQRNLDLEVHRDGTQSSKAVPGLDLLVTTTPTANTVVGGINQSTSPYWQNNINLNISTSDADAFIQSMEDSYRQCTTYGDSEPDGIFAGSKFITAYAKAVRAQKGTQIQVVAPATGGVKLDGSRTGCFFKGIELLWDPTFDTLQSLDAPTIAWDKRCYFLCSSDIKFRPVKNRWLVQRAPPRVYDRYTHYFGLTGNYGLTVRKRNGMAVLSIA